MTGAAKTHRRNWQIPVTVVLIFMGILLSMQFRSQQEWRQSLAAQKQEDLVVMWKRLTEKRQKLQVEVEDLAKQQRALEEKSTMGQNTLSDLRATTDKLKIANGLIPVKGPGISVTVTGDAPLLYLDLVDIVNELWASGAEAIAINDHRIVASTPIADAEDRETIYITVNGERLLYPVVITAIGDPMTLETGLTFPGGIVDGLSTYAISPEIKRQEELVLPAAKIIPAWRFAQPKTAAPEAKQ
ncbi:hypothetical protein SY88_07235 [Clostridiales bacterium PH28_bin88]|nr:hypothetical protein SY88_07235 [Clostridiales bacterium PH28_bin88]